MDREGGRRKSRPLVATAVGRYGRCSAGAGRRPAGERDQGFLNVSRIQGGIATGTDDQIVPAGELTASGAKRFADVSLPTVAEHRVPDLFRDGHAQSRVRLGRPPGVHHQGPIGGRPAATDHLGELLGGPQAERFAEALIHAELIRKRGGLAEKGVGRKRGLTLCAFCAF